MTRRMSQVKFRVRHNALLLREFSVAEMVRVTGLNPESVRTELQRMKQEGLLTAEPQPRQPGQRGGRIALYRLTDDPEARLALSESIEAFYPPPPPTDQPTSRYYLLAQQALNQAQTTTDNVQRKQLLSQAERDLEMAEQAEGASLAPESIRAYLQYEWARLAYLRGKRDEAAKSFQALQEFFAGMQDETMVNRIGEYMLCLKAHQRFTEETITFDDANPTFLARCLLKILEEAHYQTDSPLIVRMLKLLRQLSQTTSEKIQAAAFTMNTETNRRIEAELDTIRIEQTRLNYQITLRQQEHLLPPSWPSQDELHSTPPDKWKQEEWLGHSDWRPERGGKYDRN